MPSQLPLMQMQIRKGLRYVNMLMITPAFLLLFKSPSRSANILQKKKAAMTSKKMMRYFPKSQWSGQAGATRQERMGLQRQVCLSQGDWYWVASKYTLQSRSVKMLKTPSLQFSPLQMISIKQIRMANPTTANINQLQGFILIIISTNDKFDQFSIKEQYFMEQDHPPPKKSLCRFYLRGLCIYKSKQCPFSHGVWDLDYDYYKEGEHIDYDYQKYKDKFQKNTIKGPRIFINLYQFQTEKVYSLEELNNIKFVRAEVRNLMHQQLYLDFMDLLEIKHPNTPFTEQFLLRQFTRVGFNKILMVTMKFSHILAYICEAPGSKHFKTTIALPPDGQRTAVIIRKASDQEIKAVYRQEYKGIMDKVDKSIQENAVKKQLFTAKLPDNVPPLNLVLKDKKLLFSQFIQKFLQEDSSKIVLQASIESIHEEATSYLKEKLPFSVVNWNDMYNYLSKALKTNNGKILNEVKPYLVLEHNHFLFFPLIQFIYNPKLNGHLFKDLKLQPCKCPFQNPYKEEDLLFDTKNFKELKEGESYDINNFQSLIACAPHILSSEVLGVDLEGNLRKGGFVEMIQLNNGKNTFLIDIWEMNQKGDFQTFWLARKILRNVMVNPKIVKIFHDCRHDSIGLHEMIETCIVNVFDTSACETLINQLNLYNKLAEKEKQHKQTLNDCKNVITQCTNVKTPGLNEILKKYEATHGQNKNKDKFHKMWSKGDISLFVKRPLDPDYRDYCIRDVLDLPEVHRKMVKQLPEEAVEMGYWVSTLYAQSAYQPE